MATKKKAVKRRKSHSKRRRVSGLQPAVVSGTRGKKTARRRKRRMTGTKGLTGNKIMDALIGVAAGQGVGIVMDKLSQKIPGVKIDSRIVDGVKVLGGGAMAYMGMKKDNMFVAGLGLGVFGSGANTGAHNFGIVSGVEDFMQGIGQKDEMLIQLNGLNETGDIQPDVIGAGGYSQSYITESDDKISGGDMPSVISGR